MEEEEDNGKLTLDNRGRICYHGLMSDKIVLIVLAALALGTLALASGSVVEAWLAPLHDLASLSLTKPWE